MLALYANRNIFLGILQIFKLVISLIIIQIISVILHEMFHLIFAIFNRYIVARFSAVFFKVELINIEKKIKIKLIKPTLGGQCIAYPRQYSNSHDIKKWGLYIVSGFIFNIIYFIFGIYLVITYGTNNLVVNLILVCSIYNLIDSIIYNKNSEVLNDLTIFIGILCKDKWAEVLYKSNVFMGYNLQKRRPREMPKELFDCLTVTSVISNTGLNKLYLTYMLYYFIDIKDYYSAKNIINKLYEIYNNDVPIQLASLNLFIESYVFENYEISKSLFENLDYNENITETLIALTSYYILLNNTEKAISILKILRGNIKSTDGVDIIFNELEEEFENHIIKDA